MKKEKKPLFWCEDCNKDINSDEALKHIEEGKKWNGKDKCMLHPYRG